MPTSADSPRRPLQRRPAQRRPRHHPHRRRRQLSTDSSPATCPATTPPTPDTIWRQLPRQHRHPCTSPKTAVTCALNSAATHPALIDAGNCPPRNTPTPGGTNRTLRFTFPPRMNNPRRPQAANLNSISAPRIEVRRSAANGGPCEADDYRLQYDRIRIWRVTGNADACRWRRDTADKCYSAEWAQ